MFGIAVLASGSGSNLQALIDTLHGKRAGIEIVLAAGNRGQAYALERARSAGIPTAVFPLSEHPDRPARDLAMARAIEEAGADLVVLAGYMALLTPDFLARFPYRVVNLHPALLPSFPGDTPIPDTIEYGVKMTGVTVHFVDEGVDTGPVIAQEALPVHEGDTEETLAERIHALEHMLLPRTVELIAEGKVHPPEPGSRVVKVNTGS